MDQAPAAPPPVPEGEAPPAEPVSGPLSRRIFLRLSGSAAIAGGVAAGSVDVGAQGARGTPPGPANRPPPAQHSDAAPQAGSAAAGTEPLQFFNREEAALVAALADRLIPPDALGPGGVQAGVPQYIDRQLAGAFGAGERLYRSGPWLAGTPSQGYQLPFTPAELWRQALRGIAADLARDGGRRFEALPGDQQDAYLSALQAGTRDIGAVPAKVFFETMLAMTIEGYFADPAYGGNRGMAAWRMIGFPGAHASYFDLVDRHGLAYAAAPVSIADDHGTHGHAPPGADRSIDRGSAPPAAPRGR